ncbi:MAG: PAS domain S-box protein, partial [Candidatus Krumholzibacteriia bacterium]
MFHRLLQHQLKRLGLEERNLPPDAATWQQFLQCVSRAYADGSQERHVLERSLTVSSREMQELCENLRQSSEARITLERNQLRSVISSLGAGLCTLDENGGLVSMNPEAERILGRREKELGGQDFIARVVNPAASHDSLADRDSLREVLEAGTMVRSESAEFRRRDGTTIPVSFGLNAMVEDGKLRGSVLVFFDVTERVRAHAERDRLFWPSVDMVCVVDFGGLFERINPAFERVLGYREEELLARPFTEYVHEQDLERTQGALLRLESGEETDFENRFRCQDGSYRWLEWKAVSAASEQRIHAVARDITNRKEAEAELARLASFPKQDPNPIVEMDQSGELSYVNPAATVALPDLERLGAEHPVLQDAWPLAQQQLAEGSNPISREVACGEHVFVQKIHVSPAGRKLRIYMTDITEQKKAAAAHPDAQEAVPAHSRAKPEVLTAMSHEIRTPANAVIGVTGLLLDTEL